MARSLNISFFKIHDMEIISTTLPLAYLLTIQWSRLKKTSIVTCYLARMHTYDSSLDFPRQTFSEQTGIAVRPPRTPPLHHPSHPGYVWEKLGRKRRSQHWTVRQIKTLVPSFPLSPLPEPRHYHTPSFHFTPHPPPPHPAMPAQGNSSTVEMLDTKKTCMV